MKKSPLKNQPVPKNQPVLPEKATKKIPALKLNSTNQVILAAIVVLLIFIVAVMSSTPKQSQQTPGDQQQGTAQTAGEGTMSGQQVARISITRSDSQQALGTNTNTTGNANAVLADIAKDATAAIPAGARVKFQIDNFKKLAVQPLKFNVYDEYGRELTPEYLQTVHENKMHMIVVSANLREYNHVMPEFKNGVWNASVNLPNPGTYYAYIEVSPIKGGQTMLRSELTVREPSKGKPDYPGLTPNNLAISGDVSTVLNFTDAGLESLSTLMFSLTRGGKNVNDVKPFQDAFGHVVLIKHDDTLTFGDAYPLPVNDETKGIFEFATKFHKAGRYTAYAEFKVGEKVMVFPITFDVQ
jgi:hypothetical protein